MSGRSRIHITGTSLTQGVRAATAIDEQFICPFNCTVLQFAAIFTEPVTTSENFEFGKLSAIGFGYEMIFRAYDPVVDGGLVFVCNEHFEVLKGETFFIRYPNTDEVIVGYEGVLTEVF